MKRRYIFQVLAEAKKSLSCGVHIVVLPYQNSLHYDNCHVMQQNVKRDLMARGFKRVKYEGGELSASWDCELVGAYKNASY